MQLWATRCDVSRAAWNSATVQAVHWPRHSFTQRCSRAKVRRCRHAAAYARQGVTCWSVKTLFVNVLHHTAALLDHLTSGSFRPESFMATTAANQYNAARSTKGASKQRRDLINTEIDQLKELLPLPETVRQRLFQLQVMSLTCIFIRKDRYLPHIIGNRIAHRTVPRRFEFMKALRSFLLLITRQGKLLYISENAGDFLGYSVEEIMSQGDSFYDIVDSRDHLILQAELLSGPPSISCFPPDPRIFVCRMNLNRAAKRQPHYQKFVIIHGRYLHPAEYYQALLSVRGAGHFLQPVFAAFCSPLVSPETADLLAVGNPVVFNSVHNMDMKFIHIDDTGVCHLGYPRPELVGKSWYAFLYPSDVLEASTKHRLLCEEKEASCTLLIRLRTMSGSWLWVHTVLALRDGTTNHNVQQLIMATYQMLSDLEVKSLGAAAMQQGVRTTGDDSASFASDTAALSLFARRESVKSPDEPMPEKPSKRRSSKPKLSRTLSNELPQSDIAPHFLHNTATYPLVSPVITSCYERPFNTVSAADAPWIHHRPVNEIRVHIPRAGIPSSPVTLRSLLTPEDSPSSAKDVIIKTARTPYPMLPEPNTVVRNISCPQFSRLPPSQVNPATSVESLPVIEPNALEAFFRTVESVDATRPDASRNTHNADAQPRYGLPESMSEPVMPLAQTPQYCHKLHVPVNRHSAEYASCWTVG